MRRFLSILASIVVVLAALGALSLIPLSQEYSPMEGQITGNIPQLSLERFSEADIGLDPGSLEILLTSECRRLTMVTSQEQVQSIARGLENTTGFRPLSHDLLGSMADELGIEVLMAKIEDMRDGTYYARLLLRQGNKILNLDSRPSDAIAIALKTGSPVYVSQELLDRYGMNIC